MLNNSKNIHDVAEEKKQLYIDYINSLNKHFVNKKRNQQIKNSYY